MVYEQTDKISEEFKKPLWRLSNPGTAPILLRAIAGELTIRTSRAAQMKAWTLDINGKRRAEVPLRVQDGAIVLPITAAQAAVYYEIAAE